MWFCRDIVLDMVTPRYGYCVTMDSVHPPRWWSALIVLRRRVIRMVWHCLVLHSICHMSDHFWSMFRCSWRATESAGLEMVLYYRVPI